MKDTDIQSCIDGANCVIDKQELSNKEVIASARESINNMSAVNLHMLNAIISNDKDHFTISVTIIDIENEKSYSYLTDDKIIITRIEK